MCKYICLCGFRTDIERKEEADLQKKIRAAYKAHKAQTKKQKEKEKAHTAAITTAEARSLRPATIEEAPEEEEAAEEQSDEDEDPEQVPELKELNDAFDSFAIQAGASAASLNSESSYDALLTIANLQAVLVQVLNRFVPMEDILDAYYDDCGYHIDHRDVKTQTVDYDQFRRIHFGLQVKYDAEDEQNNQKVRKNSDIVSMSRAGSRMPSRANLYDNAQLQSEGSRRKIPVDVTPLDLSAMPVGSGTQAVRNKSKI